MYILKLNILKGIYYIINVCYKCISYSKFSLLRRYSNTYKHRVISVSFRCASSFSCHPILCRRRSNFPVLHYTHLRCRRANLLPSNLHRVSLAATAEIVREFESRSSGKTVLKLFDLHRRM